MKKVALVIGHNEASQGAVNRDAGITEWRFNDILSFKIEARAKGAEIIRVYRDTYSGLPGKINAINPDFIISMHCNAYNRRASGTEVLYYHKSTAGKNMAILLNGCLVEAMGLPDRGIKPKGVEDRGGYLLKNTAAPCVISEPFFIDNNQDLAQVQGRYVDLVDAYIEAIERLCRYEI